MLELRPIEAIASSRPPRPDGTPTDTRGLGAASDVVLRVRYEGSGPADTWNAWLVCGDREVHLFGGDGSLFDVARVVAIDRAGGRVYVATLWIPEELRFYAALVRADTLALDGEPIAIEPRFTVDFPRTDDVTRTYPLLVLDDETTGDLGRSRGPMIALVSPGALAHLYAPVGRRAFAMPFRAPAWFHRLGAGDDPPRASEPTFVPLARLVGARDRSDAYLEPIAPL